MNIEIRNICIGDWVKVYYESYHRFEIERLTIAHFKTHTLLNDIFPIKLTPKVLSSIGFTTGDSFSELNIGDWTIQCDCKHIRGIKKETPSIGTEVGGGSFDLPCQYLHEVQRVFRLAKIDKSWENAPST